MPTIISIHALRVEGDVSPFANAIAFIPFLSTPSGWRATLEEDSIAHLLGFLSTPSGWRATHIVLVDGFGKLFLSTPSGWRATTAIMHP